VGFSQGGALGPGKTGDTLTGEALFVKNSNNQSPSISWGSCLVEPSGRLDLKHVPGRKCGVTHNDLLSGAPYQLRTVFHPHRQITKKHHEGPTSVGQKLCFFKRHFTSERQVDFFTRPRLEGKFLGKRGNHGQRKCPVLIPKPSVNTRQRSTLNRKRSPFRTKPRLYGGSNIMKPKQNPGHPRLPPPTHPNPNEGEKTPESTLSV